MTDPFLAALAQPQPIPAGGAAMAHAGRMALALTEKIVRLEARRRGLPSEDSVFWTRLLSKLQAISEELQRLEEEDGQAYREFMEAKPSGNSSKEMKAALARAAEVPIRIMEKAREGLECAAEAGEHCKVHVRPDCHAACELLKGAYQGARAIARANLEMAQAFKS